MIFRKEKKINWLFKWWRPQWQQSYNSDDVVQQWKIL